MLKMNRLMQLALTSRQLKWLEVIIIVAFAIVPLFSSFPYRVNIFLSWEGAYRLYLGQVPFKDFGLPMGFAFWVIPAFFFKVFGPYLISLVKAQVFINIISGLSFRSILKSFQVVPGLRLISILLFCISYSFFNFWPWYNHSVIVFELIGISFLLKYIFRKENSFKNYTWLALGTFFLFTSFFTKQDGGGLAFMLAFFMIVYHAIVERRYTDIAWFVLCYSIWAIAFILPFATYEFSYWFNLGQEPHNSRIQLWDFISATLGESKWEKFYLGAMGLVLLFKSREIKSFFFQKKDFLFYLFTLGILVEALIFQVTSYTPPDNNIFFHSFAFAYLFSLTSFSKKLTLLPNLLAAAILVMLWWSGAYWKYIDRKLTRLFPEMSQVDESKISRSTYVVSSNDDENIDMAKWTFSDIKAFQKIYMPEPTIRGMERLLSMDIVKNEDSKILNMTELTPLAHAIGYELEKNKPLWYHKGVGMFQREEDEYIKEVKEGKYDLVLFEVIPYLNNFYPTEVRLALQDHYLLYDRFLAPRRPTDSHIEVYIKKTSGIKNNKILKIDE